MDVIHITEEQAEALIHQGPCRSAREIGVEIVELANDGVCPFCDLARLLEKNQIHFINKKVK